VEIKHANPTVSGFWWTLVSNWGDRLTPLLLRRFAHVEATLSLPAAADVVCVGSILGNLVKPDYTGVILGSGKLHESGIVPPGATILALRGPLTAMNVPGEYALGDPGLLADELVNVETRTHELGIVPHWSDKTLSSDKRFTPFDPLIIHSSTDPLAVIRSIGSCKKIVSSSLHGLILADAFGIPRRFEPSAKWAREGGDFKVRDHNAAVGLDHKVGVVQQVDRNVIVDLKTGLARAFAHYGQIARAK
jgi:pyruvyltransferase